MNVINRTHTTKTSKPTPNKITCVYNPTETREVVTVTRHTTEIKSSETVVVCSKHFTKTEVKINNDSHNL